MTEIHKMRREYTNSELNISDLDPSPFHQFKLWFDEILQAEIPMSNAMLLATTDADNHPSSRIVLLKEFDDTGFTFFTNYTSNKAHDLENNPYACLTFWWSAHTRQIHIKGAVKKVPASVSDAYFATRDRESCLGAYASQQSEVIENRAALEDRYHQYKEQFPEQSPVPRPDFWGGYILIPDSVEFWSGRENRLHDRFVYTKDANGAWVIERLAP